MLAKRIHNQISTYLEDYSKKMLDFETELKDRMREIKYYSQDIKQELDNLKTKWRQDKSECISDFNEIALLINFTEVFNSLISL